jgi:hypothetical protein
MPEATQGSRRGRCRASSNGYRMAGAQPLGPRGPAAWAWRAGCGIAAPGQGQGGAAALRYTSSSSSPLPRTGSTRPPRRCRTAAHPASQIGVPDPGCATNRLGRRGARASSQLDQRCDGRDAGSMLAFHSVQQGNHRVGEEFLYELKAGLRAAASGGRPRAGSDTTAAVEPGSPSRSVVNGATPNAGPCSAMAAGGHRPHGRTDRRGRGAPTATRRRSPFAHDGMGRWEAAARPRS